MTLNLRRVQLAKFFQFQTQPMTQRTLSPQLIEQGLGFFERVRGGNFFGLEQVPKAALDLRFRKQGKLLE